MTVKSERATDGAAVVLEAAKDEKLRLWEETVARKGRDLVL